MMVYHNVLKLYVNNKIFKELVFETGQNIWICYPSCYKVRSSLTAIVSLLIQEDPSLAGKGSVAIYGMAGKLPDTALLDEFFVQFLMKSIHFSCICC